jgi:hypothetical protein
MRVPSLEGSTVAALAKAIAAGDIKLDEVKEYLFFKTAGGPPTTGGFELGRLLAGLSAGITADALKLSATRGDRMLRNDAYRPIISSAMHLAGSESSVRDQLVESVIAQIEARITFNALLPERIGRSVDAPAEPIRLLATALVEKTVTIQALAEALGADELPVHPEEEGAR